MLAGARGNFKRFALRRQDLLQHRKNRLLVAVGGGAEGGFGHGRFRWMRQGAAQRR